MGLQAKRFPIKEQFSFLITDPGFNDPDSEAYNPNLAPYDGTRGGSPFAFSSLEDRHLRRRLTSRTTSGGTT